MDCEFHNIDLTNLKKPCKFGPQPKGRGPAVQITDCEMTIRGAHAMSCRGVPAMSRGGVPAMSRGGVPAMSRGGVEDGMT